jgi:hypothetical protein
MEMDLKCKPRSKEDNDALKHFFSHLHDPFLPPEDGRCFADFEVVVICIGCSAIIVAFHYAVSEIASAIFYVISAVVETNGIYNSRLFLTNSSNVSYCQYLYCCMYIMLSFLHYYAYTQSF